jgi:hypothetical protein
MTVAGGTRDYDECLTDDIDIYELSKTRDWGSGFESFEPAACRRLDLYDRFCRELGESTFLNRRLVFKVAAEQTLDHAGPDALRAMTMPFRKLWMQGEPARFQDVLRLLRDNAKDEEVEPSASQALGAIGRHFRNARRAVMMRHVIQRDARTFPEPLRDFTAEEVIDDWLNGVLFHADEEAEKRVRAWNPTTYEFSVIKAIWGVVGPMWELHVVVSAVLDRHGADAAA